MNALERTHNFIENSEVARIPFHPILMRFTAKYSGVNYSDFCLKPEVKCDANIKCAKDFNYDWVNVMSDAYAEAEAYGDLIEYPVNNLPMLKKHAINNMADIDKLIKPDINSHARLKARIKEIEIYKKELGDSYMIAGWVEGPFGEYCDIRDMSLAMLDFYEHPAKLEQALDIITEFSIEYVAAQIKAGAHCIGIGDAACSQISPDLYKDYIFEREKAIIDEVHANGALVKLHICGNTTAILPDMIKTGADIVDIDHLVTSMREFTSMLGENQVFCGNSDPVSVIMNGSVNDIKNSVEKCYAETNGRCITSAGCEIPAETSIENMNSYAEAAHKISSISLRQH
jgi:MtaA/CmuA family methyltransferase